MFRMKSKMLRVTLTLKGNNSSGIEGKQVADDALLLWFTTKRPMNHYKIFPEERQRDMLLWPKGQHAGHQQDEPENKPQHTTLDLRLPPLREHEGPGRGTAGIEGLRSCRMNMNQHSQPRKAKAEWEDSDQSPQKSQFIWMGHHFTECDSWNICSFFLGQMSLGISR